MHLLNYHGARSKHASKPFFDYFNLMIKFRNKNCRITKVVGPFD